MVGVTDSAQSKQLDQQEHNADAGAKRVVIRAQNPSSGTFVNIAATDNGDGTFSLKTSNSATDLDIRNLVFATDKVDVSGSSSVGVTGTFFQVTQPVSAASLPLPSGASTSTKQDTIITQLQTINSLTPAVYDYISLSYTGDNLTGVVFKTGGSGGTTISTLTLAYSGSTLTSVTKT